MNGYMFNQNDCELVICVYNFQMDEIDSTYMTGKTLGNTTDPSAKYWYNTRVSFWSLVYLTSVAITVRTKACVDRSGITSGSRSTFDSFETDDREPRSYIFILEGDLIFWTFFS